jgi:hypothetical protein
MMKWMLAAGAAALAITAPSAAQQGGRGQHAQAQKPDRGGGGQKARAQRGGDRQASPQRSGGDRQVRAERSGGNRQVRTERSNRQVQANRGSDRARGQTRMEARGPERAGTDRIDRANTRAVRVERSPNRAAKIERVDRRNDLRVARNQDVVRGRDANRFALAGNDNVIRVRDIDRGVVRVRNVDRDDLFVQRLGFGAGGCPPGLARKPIACLPPGQAAKLVGEPLVAATRLTALAPLPLSMRSLYWDNDDYYYRWGGGYLYRVDRDDALIAAMVPLFGAALLGQPLQPYYLNNYYRPSYFNAFYPNSPYDCYRYGYGYVYETDCMTGLVENVIPTYDYGYGVGQLMPASYGYYNVPFAYRSYFIDNDDYYYRYAPGAIYRVDRGTALVSAVAALLTGGLTVGQPLPIGYSAYNVPLAYRSTYYDRPDIWYRYDNGYIYGIDPRTRVVSNVAYVIV